MLLEIIAYHTIHALTDGLKQRFKGYRNFKDFQFLDFPLIFFDFSSYLELNIIPAGAIFHYLLGIYIPIFTGYGHT